jgi:SpoVK/Ycf46/Vps4 family AAA+-type ATPase
VLILSPVVQIPTELEKLLVVVEHPLPDRGQLAEIARGVAGEQYTAPEGGELDRLVDAAVGLTRLEAENAFSLSLVRHDRFEVATLWELKSQMLRKSGLVTLHRGGEKFDRLGGLESLKAFCKRAIRPRSTPCPARPRGVLLLSPPGCGKSQFAKSLGNETGRPTLVLDIGSLMGSLVGSTEANIRQALKIADAMAPAVLFLDECEKALSGVASSGQTDSGVSARLFGTFLSWLNDHESDVFVVATCNDITKLPPEFSRAERFDGIFFVDLPDPAQRRAIWDIYLAHYQLDSTQKLPADDQWTGAEIKSCCRLAALLDLPLSAASQNIVPVARTSAESVEKLRQWASGRCLSADRAGIYQSGAAGSTSRRRVQRGPSDPSLN